MNLIRVLNILLDHTIPRKGKPTPIGEILKGAQDTFNSQKYTPETRKARLQQIFTEAKANAKTDGIDEKGLEELSTLLDELLILAGASSYPINFPEYQGSQSPKLSMANVLFRFGNPNTGKSFGFQETSLGLKSGMKYKYSKITVSGGVGNEHRGLQSSDLAISMDTVNRTIKLGPLLTDLMQAILNPTVTHVVVLDDAHNQNLSSLLSEFTPVFKEGEKVVADDKRKTCVAEAIEKVRGKNFKASSIVNLDQFNELVRDIRNYLISNGVHVGNAQITNRFTGENIELIFPDNFYLLVAGNYNRNTYEVFADWRDRAKVESVHSLSFEILNNSRFKNDSEKVLLNRINVELKEVLKQNNIFDYERYLFGIFKSADGKTQDEMIKFAFGMIKNSMVEHQNGHKVNQVGKILINRLQQLTDRPLVILEKDGEYSVEFSEAKGVVITKDNQNQILHALNLYQQED